MSLDTVLSHNIGVSPRTPEHPDGCALVLMGGGARTAYQAGVLQAIGTMLAPSMTGFPFRWLFGTSAGALNASFLASHALSGADALAELSSFWRALRSDHVYRLDAPSWVRASRVLAGWTLSRQVKQHRALLDTMPLVDTLHRAINLQQLERAFEQRALDALGVTASSYTTGEHWTFCQTPSDTGHQPWHRPGRRADFQPITIEHLMASSAIPFLFPAVPLWVNGRREHFGDGSMRQLSPLSPAIHFGARRVLVIGVGQPQRSGLVAHNEGEPTAGTIAGHAMASVFHDTLQSDVEQTLRVSQTLARLPPDLAAALPYRPVEVLAIQPSVSLDEIALKHVQELPISTRHTLMGLGVLDTQRGANASAAALASYLLFEPGFVQALIALGEHDAWRRQAELKSFMAPAAAAGGTGAMP
ncbi:MAG: patatin-like phospholipase family protein [Hydrogenophaga sp.]|uniref:patatin-like phospholipase family protein n=1 Tax=Hydrogenophaga sp. TaxID=1904254 RepID=UPI001DAA871E|nr:patatin-like phospholipase family protein [Hydrogenophaga sp.]MBX3608371.1 patatin-like phospholipase family protein [Hydrogenophaga sp.]